MKIEVIEDEQRFQEDSYKEILAALRQVEQETDQKNVITVSSFKFRKYLKRI